MKTKITKEDTYRGYNYVRESQVHDDGLCTQCWYAVAYPNVRFKAEHTLHAFLDAVEGAITMYIDGAFLKNI